MLRAPHVPAACVAGQVEILELQRRGQIVRKSLVDASPSQAFEDGARGVEVPVVVQEVAARIVTYLPQIVAVLALLRWRPCRVAADLGIVGAFACPALCYGVLVMRDGFFTPPRWSICWAASR